MKALYKFIQKQINNKNVYFDYCSYSASVF